jgi:hypothetical protein
VLTLYAITDKRPKLPGLKAMRVGPAWVVVARAKEKSVPTPTLLKAYDRVVRRIAGAVPALLPFRYGSMARDEEDVAHLLAPVTSSIAGALDRTRDCVQFTLRVHGEAGKKKKKKKVKTAKVEGGPGTRWLAARREALRVPEIDPVTERTAPYVREVRSERHAPPRHLATVYHLVPRREVRPWRAALEEGVLALDGVTITTSGPWPPYAFAELP